MIRDAIANIAEFYNPFINGVVLVDQALLLAELSCGEKHIREFLHLLLSPSSAQSPSGIRTAIHMYYMGQKSSTGQVPKCCLCAMSFSFSD